jgi:polysaccharide biosynthesis transport protein
MVAARNEPRSTIRVNRVPRQIVAGNHYRQCHLRLASICGNPVSMTQAGMDIGGDLIEPLDEPEFDLRGIVGVLRRHWKLVLATLVSVLAAAALFLLFVPPIYTASTLILVDPAHKDLLDPNQRAGESGTENARVESEVELVRSEATLVRVIDALHLTADPEFGPHLGLLGTAMSLLAFSPGTPQTPDAILLSTIDNLRDALRVQRRGLTYLISIEMNSSDPAKAASIANAVASSHIKEQLDAKIQSTLASRDIIQSRVADAGTAVSDSEKAFDDFIAQYIDAIAAQSGRKDLLELRQQLAAIGARRAQTTASVSLVEQSLANGDWPALATALGSDAIRGIEAKRSGLATELAALAQGSERANGLKAQIADLQGQLQTAAMAALTSLRDQIVALQTQASSLRDQLPADLLGSDLPPEVLTRIYELQQNAEIARAQYQTLLARLRDLDAQAYLQVPDSRVVSAALSPNAPSFPNPPLVLTVAGVLGIGLGVLLAFLLENYVGGFTSEAQTQAVLKTKVVAAMPRQRGDKRAAGETTVADYVLHSPLSPFAESVRRIRGGIDRAVRNKTSQGGITVMVSSAAPGEGKTTVALSLARAYALSGRSTLLIDCDLRKPSVHRQLGLDPSNGLIDYLSHGKRPAPGIDTFMTMDHGSGAQVIVGSRRSDVPTDELVSSRTFARLVDAARQNFDIVIIDTPPLGPVVDGLYLAPLADAIVFVIRWTKTSQQEVRRGLTSLEDAKRPEARIVAVLNQQEGAPQGYSSKYAGYYSAAT